jgi:hypothetical protein
MGSNSIANAGGAVGFVVGGAVTGLALRWALRKKTGTRSPAWHADPSGAHTMRYWNGVAWTRFVYAVHAPAPHPDMPPPALG